MNRGIRITEPGSTSTGVPRPGNSGDKRKVHRVVSSPRQLLVATAIAMTIIAWWTPHVDRDFLFWPWLWVAVAAVCALTCLLASIRPRRFYVATAGATLVTSAVGRGLALVVEAIDNPDRFWRAEAVIAMFKWWGIAVLGYVVWREYVLPWAIALEARDDAS